MELIETGELDTSTPTFTLNQPSTINTLNQESYGLSGTCSKEGSLHFQLGAMKRVTNCSNGEFSVSGWNVSSLPLVGQVLLTVKLSTVTGNTSKEYRTTITRQWGGFIDNDNTDFGFAGGVHKGTLYSSNQLALNTLTNTSELDSTWTPKYANLIAYWKLNNDFLDSVGPHHASVAGSPTFSFNERIGSHAIDLDGVDDQLSTPYHSDFNFGSTDFAVGGWFMREENCSGWHNNTIINRWNTGASAGSNEWNLSTCNASNTNSLSFDIESGTTTYKAVITDDLPSLGVWAHVMGVREGNNIKLYINGKLRAATDVTGLAVNNVPARDTYIGRIHGGSGYHN
jgi:hypothetical protein